MVNSITFCLPIENIQFDSGSVLWLIYILSLIDQTLYNFPCTFPCGLDNCLGHLIFTFTPWQNVVLPFDTPSFSTPFSLFSYIFICTKSFYIANASIQYFALYLFGWFITEKSNNSLWKRKKKEKTKKCYLILWIRSNAFQCRTYSNDRGAW